MSFLLQLGGCLLFAFNFVAWFLAFALFTAKALHFLCSDKNCLAPIRFNPSSSVGILCESEIFNLPNYEWYLYGLYWKTFRINIWYISVFVWHRNTDNYLNKVMVLSEMKLNKHDRNNDLISYNAASLSRNII